MFLGYSGYRSKCLLGHWVLFQHLFPTSVSHLSFLYSFIFMPCLGLCETELPKGKIKKKEVSGPLKLWSGSSVLQYFLFTPPDMQTCAVSYSTFFSCRKNSSQLYDRRKEARKADTWFPGSRRCFRHCGLQIDLPVYWSGRSHPLQENNLPGLNLKGSNPFESAYLEEPRYSKDLYRECVF